MSDEAKLYQDQVLPELQNFLARFQEDAVDTIQQIELKTRRIEEYLQERENYWRMQVQDCEARVYAAQSAFYDCQADADRNCYGYECALDEAYRDLREAEECFYTVQKWRQRFDEVNNSYQRQAHQLRQYLEQQIPKAQHFLCTKTQDIVNYHAVVVPEVNAPSFDKIQHAAYAAFRETKDNKNPWKMQGQAGEMVANLNGNRFSLDTIAKNLKSVQHGAYFVLYDNISDTGQLGSVKARGIPKNQTPLTARQETSVMYNYLKDFQNAIGEGDQRQFWKAASLLLEAKQANLISIPPDSAMQSINTVEDAMVYLRQHGELQVPSDQVEKVRKKVRKQYTHLPQAEREALAQRVVSLPATTRMIADMMRNYKNTRRRLDALKLDIG